MTAQDLKNAILQLAVQGKLVPQDPNDEPVSELLKSIRAEKERLIKDGKIKKEKQLSPITEDEIPFDIPESWQWVRFEQIGYFSSGYTPKQDNISNIGVIPYFKISDMNNSDNQKYLIKTKLYLKAIQARLFKKNSIVYPKNGGAVYTNKRRILADDSVVDLNTGVYTLYLENMLPYIFLIFKSIDFKNYSIASPLPTLDMTAIRKIPIPLPPLAEQERIVAKIEELMPLVEEYGKAEERLTALNAEFPDKLRKSILQQAIQGKLTERDPADEPASKLLKRIRAEKEQLIKEGKIKKEKPLPPITEEEIPFDIPDSWEWIKLGEVVSVISGTSYKSKDVCKTGIRILRGGNLQESHVHYYDDDVFLPDSFYDADKTIRIGDILIVASTGSKAVIGKPGFVNLTDDHTQIGAFLRIVRPFNEQIIGFLRVIFDSEFYRNHIRQEVQGMNINNVRTEHITELVVPIPPLAEQKRIVDRLDKLLAVCDEIRD